MGSEIISYEDGDGFTIDNLRFRILKGSDVRRATTKREILIVKTPVFLRKYDTLLNSIPLPNVVEFGFAEGGSLIYYALAFPDLKFVGIDMREPNEQVQAHIDRLGLGDRIKLYYRVDQADDAKVKRIINENFGDEPLGAIIDDASHRYEPSRKTFENCFGALAIGGTYCIESWSWAHEPGRTQKDLWLDRPSVANLIFEITLLQPSTGDLVRSIKLDRHIAFIERGAEPVSHRLNLDKLINNRGKKLELV